MKGDNPEGAETNKMGILEAGFRATTHLRAFSKL